MPQPTRRKLIAMMVGAFAVATAARPGFGQRTASPQPMPSPNAPENENVPAGLDGANIPWNSQKTLVPAEWIEIRSDSAKLLSMATDFKERVDHTNFSSTLSLPLIKEAQEIEKLAKKIRNRMK